nr:hypothetical protein [Tanacetum cinerariifolium]
EEFTTFLNVLFDADYEFDSSDDQSLYDEDVPEKIFSNPLFEEEIIPMKIDQHHDNAESGLVESLRTHDSSLIISSKIDSLFDEFAGELTLLKSIPSGIDETNYDPEEDIRLIERLLYDNSSPRPPEEFVFENSNTDIESFSPFPIRVEDSDSLIEEIDLSFTLDDPMPPCIEEDDYDSERDILIFEELLDNYSLSLPENESFHFDSFILSSSCKTTRWIAPDCDDSCGLSFCPSFTRASHPQLHFGNPILACYDDDDDYNFAITPNEPVDSLIMGHDHLNTIPTMESDGLIKSSVENLVLNLSESEGENKCDMPACFTTFWNILFDAYYESDSSDYQSCSDEDFLEEIFSNPLFEEEIIPMKIDQHHFNVESDLIESMLNHDSSIIPSSLKIDSLLDEFAGELTFLKSITPGIDETDCHPENEIRLIERLLYDNSSPRPPKEFVSENSYAEIESFSPSLISIEDNDYLMKEMDLSCTLDDPMPLSIEDDDDDDSERDILILEELLDNYSLSLPVNESFHFDIPSFSRPPAKPPDGDTRILNIKMMGDISDQKVPMPRLMITRVSNQEKSLDLLSHRSLENFQLSAKNPMMIHGKNIPILNVPLFYFYPP